MLSSRAVWHVLERYYDLRDSYPISSPLEQAGGGSHITKSGATPTICFLCEVGAVLEQLTNAQLKAIRSAFRERRAADDANANAKNADSSARRTSIKNERESRIKSRREWVEITKLHRRRLRRIRQLKSYGEAMTILCEELEPMVLIKQLARILQAV